MLGYSPHSSLQWTAFARLILQASYEATFCAAILNRAKTGNNRLYLTLIGGGVFGNEIEWITEAIERAKVIYHDAGLDVVIVSYGTENARIQGLLKRFR